MIDIVTMKNRPKDGKHVIAILCDDGEQFNLMMSDIISKYECTVRPFTNGKPVDVGASTGKDSANVSPCDNGSNSYVESIKDSTIKVSQDALTDIKRMATDSTRGKAVKRLLAGKVIMARNSRYRYEWIASLASALNKIADAEIIHKAKFRDGAGRLRNGYFLAYPSLFKG